MSQQLTPEGYKVEVLKSRISTIVAEYEERIANYEVVIQQQKQELEMLREPEAKANVEE